MKIISAFCLLAMLASQTIHGQTTTTIPTKKRGTIYLSWGYNREFYSKSDIHFQSNGFEHYDFIYENATAHEKPGFNHGVEDFFNTDLTIPQYNLHIGYLFNDKHNLGIELSWDHLKYIVDDNVTRHLKGHIRGNPIDKDTFITYDFIHLQHTNGNNYLMLNLVKQHELYASRYMNLQAIGKVGAGPLVSYTISKVLGNFNDDGFHIQGYVVGLNVGARMNFFKYLFIQPAFQYGFAHYTNSRVMADRSGEVNHMFSSYMFSLEGGFNIPLSPGEYKSFK